MLKVSTIKRYPHGGIEIVQPRAGKMATFSFFCW